MTGRYSTPGGKKPASPLSPFSRGSRHVAPGNAAVLPPDPGSQHLAGKGGPLRTLLRFHFLFSSSRRRPQGSWFTQLGRWALPGSCGLQAFNWSLGIRAVHTKIEGDT